MLMPTLAGAKEAARRIACLNNLRQLGMALRMYADENEDRFPPRMAPYWPKRLQPLYVDVLLLKCPTDRVEPLSIPGADPLDPLVAARSFVFNGWNDYFADLFGVPSTNWDLFMAHAYPGGMPEAAIPEPSETITFAEKRTESSHWHVDLLQGGGNHLEQIDEGRHATGGPRGKSGGSDFGFADGSARFLRYGQSLSPLNLWAVTPQWRTNSVALP
jgi:hypothetical protein